MIAAGVPVVPGSDGPLPDLDAAKASAAEIGYPVILKASAGGGGKGMRIVRQESELGEAFRLARAEAGASFGDDSVFLEKFVERPRHIEIQVLGDLHGKVVSLGFCALIAYSAGHFWYEAFSRGWRTETVWAIPLWIPLLPLPAGMIMTCIQYVAELMKPDVHSAAAGGGA